MIGYLKNKQSKLIENNKEFSLYNRIPVYLLAQFQEPINIQTILLLIEGSISKRFLKNVESIFIGEFKELINRRINALYKDNSIYLSSTIHPGVNESRIARDIIHEVGHSLEDEFGLEIYGDGLLANEFLGKRNRLYSLLSQNNFPAINKELFLSTEYNIELDNYFLSTIGYTKLEPFTRSLFLNPYSNTSLQEYYADAFEEYHSNKDLFFLKSISPVAYKKMRILDREVFKNT